MPLRSLPWLLSDHPPQKGQLKKQYADMVCLGKLAGYKFNCKTITIQRRGGKEHFTA
jgi:hypothetical protein